MDKMFCFQCEQTARKKAENNVFGGCTMSGVCGKKADTAKAQDELTCEMIALAEIVNQSDRDNRRAVDLITDGLFTTLTNVNFDTKKIVRMTEEVRREIVKMKGTAVHNSDELFKGQEDIVSLRSTLLFGLRGMAAYSHHARVLGKRDEDVDKWIIKGMSGMFDNRSVEDWLSLIMDFGKINLRCMEILDAANTEAYGNPVPTTVQLSIEKGPFIVITGHDLKDIKMLLEQTEGKGINIYTHGEMLPAHGYPELKKYSHLKGNFGTAWQNQQTEFDNIPAPVLFTTNCLMAPKRSYSDRVFTTSVVAFPELKHIEADENGYKDFSEIIDLSLKLGGYQENQSRTGINGGSEVTTGFGRESILKNAPDIIDAVKKGDIRHFFLVGGCDGAGTGRNYYTEFVKKTPEDSIILTLACGKFRLNDLDIGSIGGFPRILDMGQCNDAYGAIRVASALADAFECGINDLPLTLVLSWYEQKAVCILLTLLSLGIKNIYIGPELPAFFSEAVLNTIIEMFELRPVGVPEEDIARSLN